MYNTHIRHNAYHDRYSPVIFEIRIAMCADELSPWFRCSFEEQDYNYIQLLSRTCHSADLFSGFYVRFADAGVMAKSRLK